MRRWWWCGGLALLGMVLTLDAALSAPAKSPSVGGNRRRAKCKYFKKGEISECDPVTKTKSVTLHLKKGIDCEPTQVFHQPCTQESDDEDSITLSCKYEKKAEWTECGPGVLSRKKVMSLKVGQPSNCPPTRTKTVPCRSHKGRGKSKTGTKDRIKGRGKVCKYIKGAWSECDSTTNTRTRELQLKKGDKTVCLPKKEITQKCKKPCKYNKGPWQPCNSATNEKSRELTLRKGDPSICNATISVVKSCRRQDAFTAARTSQCRYKHLPWGQCDLNTNTMTRVLKLKSGDPELCEDTKQLTRKCRKPCKFSKGPWSECSNSTGFRTRRDRLTKGDPSECESVRVITKKCGKDEECKYDVGDWGDCDPKRKERKRVKTLLSGPAACEKQVTISRPCSKPNGESNCFLGKWGDYGPCQNGVMMKHRPVIAGGVQCERKAVKTKQCS